MEEEKKEIEIEIEIEEDIKRQNLEKTIPTSDSLHSPSKHFSSYSNDSDKIHICLSRLDNWRSDKFQAWQAGNILIHTLVNAEIKDNGQTYRLLLEKVWKSTSFIDIHKARNNNHNNIWGGINALDTIVSVFKQLRKHPKAVLSCTTPEEERYDNITLKIKYWFQFIEPFLKDLLLQVLLLLLLSFISISTVSPS